MNNPSDQQAVRAAAERLRRFCDGESLQDVYSRPDDTAMAQSMDRMEADESQVVIAYLAEHPASGESLAEQVARLTGKNERLTSKMTLVGDSCDGLRALIAEWAIPTGTALECGKHEATHPTTIREIIERLATLGDARLYDWARWMVWHRVNQYEQISMRCKTIEDLSEEVTRLTADRERLDWLESSMRKMIGNSTPERHIACDVYAGRPIREAIDAARGAGAT